MSTVGRDNVQIAIDDGTRPAYTEVLVDENVTSAFASLRLVKH